MKYEDEKFWNDLKKESKRAWLNANLWLIVAALALVVAFLLQY